MKLDSLEVLDILAMIKRRQGRYLALLLRDIEDALDVNSIAYKRVRKDILDNFNDYTRSIFRILIGDDIEGLTFR